MCVGPWHMKTKLKTFAVGLEWLSILVQKSKFMPHTHSVLTTIMV